ncbi:ATP-binding protein [Kineococcus indalonis]|uniref:ATP-binding protein n=1 Tax=Kineococcus indalonis TaxID=2696566 RepID=UPI001411CCA4|nr:ATP-binding protein [Kineococcus indalonis]NAZ85498.1 type IV secretion system DNA-binding domain-containing protein [Kineococcus indalonis]
MSFAVQVTAAADLTEMQEYAELPGEQERRRKALEADTSFLRSLLGAFDCTFELRWLRPDSADVLELFLLGRVVAGSRSQATARAATMRRRLADLPRHVHGQEVLDDTVVRRACHPFDPHPRGAVEVRKRVVTASPQRPDAEVAYLLAVQPWNVAPSSWGQLTSALRRHPHPITLSIALEPVDVDPGFSRMLESITTTMTRLARDGEHRPGTLYWGAVKLTPDAFAVDAEPAYTAAVRRYRGPCFRLRISLASPFPIDDALAQLVGATISPPESSAGRSHLSEQFAGAAYTVERPSTAHAFHAFSDDLASLSLTPWGGDAVWSRPDAPPAALKGLVDLVDSAEAAAAFRLPAAANGHLPGFPVLRPGLANEVGWNPSERSITLGRQLLNGQPAGDIGIDVDALTRHAFVVGTVGSGKTNTVLTMLRQLRAPHIKVPFTVIEPVNADHDDYRWLMTQPDFEDLIVLTPGNERLAPFRLNPFEVPAGVGIGAHAAALLQCFDAAYGLWDPLPYIFTRALKATYLKRGLLPQDVAEADMTWPTLTDFVTCMEEVTDKLKYSGETRDNILAASRLRAEALREGACGPTLDCARGYPISLLLERPVIIELAAIGDNDKERALVSSFILLSMTEHYKANRPVSQRLEHVTVIEEAHRLLRRDVRQDGDTKGGDARAQAAEAFANTLAENRKYGEGMIIVEQDPAKLVPDAYKNTNLKVLHRLPTEEDRQLIGGTMRLNSDQERHAASLEQMTTLIFHDTLDQAALVRSDNLRKTAAAFADSDDAPMPTRDQVRQRFLRFAEAEAAVSEALAPYPGCAGCLHKCQYRARADALVTEELCASFRQMSEAGDKFGTWWTDLDALLSAAERPLTARGTDIVDARACFLLHLARESYDNFEQGAGELTEAYRRWGRTVMPSTV